MYERYAGLIFDMDGTILDTEPTHRKAWHEVLGHYGLRFDEQAMVALNGSPTWRIAQSVIELNHADLDPHALAREKTDKVKSMLLDSVQPLPLVDVVKAWHGRRPMAVGTGVKAQLQKRCSLTLDCVAILMLSSQPITYNATNLLLIRFCFVPNVWGLFRFVASCLKMPILEYRRRTLREWTPWMSGYCE